MSHPELLRRVFVAFHLALGSMLLVGGIVAAASAGPHDPHALVLGSIEALGAVLFLLPPTLRLGAAILLVTLAAAFTVHLLRGEWPGGLVVYAAGVAFVAVHRSGYRRTPSRASTSS
jgi:hypothetical protein